MYVFVDGNCLVIFINNQKKPRKFLQCSSEFGFVYVLFVLVDFWSLGVMKGWTGFCHFTVCFLILNL